MTWVDEAAMAWTGAAVLVAVLGGLLAGALLQAFHPLSPSLVRSILQGWIMAWIGLLFYSGRISEKVVRNDATAPYELGELGLFVLFSVAVGFGAYVTKRLVQQVRNRRQDQHDQGQ